MKTRPHQDFARQRLSHHFVYESFCEQRGLFFNRGSVGFILQGWPLVGANLQAQNEISEFLKDEDNLQNGASLQVMMIGSSYIDDYLNHWASFRASNEDQIFGDLANKRIEFLKKASKRDGVLKDIFIWIAVTIPKTNISNLDDIERRRDSLKSMLSAIGMQTCNVDSAHLLKTLRLFFAWKASSHTQINQHELICEQILPPDFAMQVEDDSLTFLAQDEEQDMAVVALEAVRRPKSFALELMDLFLGSSMRRGEYIKSDFIISFGLIMLPNQALEAGSSIAKRESLAKSLKSGLLKWLPNLEAEYNDMDMAVVALQAGERMVLIGQNVILKDTKDKIKQAAFEYRSLMRRNGFEFASCKFDYLAVTLSCLPMQLVEEVSEQFGAKLGGLGIDLRKLGRNIKTLSGEAQGLLPIVGEWKGIQRSPGLLLAGRRTQLMYWSPFGAVLVPQEGKTPESNENFNLCIAGVPGSGKSVFMQELMISTLGVGGRVFVLDYGKSFKRTCQILKGNHIEFDLKNPISLNPFSEISEKDEDFEAREDILAGIAAILATMAAPSCGTNDLQNAMLQKALRSVWAEKKSKAEISDIAKYLLAQNQDYCQELGEMLFPFTQNGIYGKFFTGKAAVSMNHRIVVIETDHLRSSPALLTVVVQMMIVHINQVMVGGDRKYPFLIMIDEAWKLLQGKASGAFIEEAGRIARKYKGSITLATQQLTDYFRPESPAAEKAFENSSWKAILKQNPDSLMALRSNPKLEAFVKEDWQLELLQSVHSKPPAYSEVALFGPDVKGVIGRLMLDPFTMLLTSTNAEDYQALETRIANGMSLTSSIEEILKLRGLA